MITGFFISVFASILSFVVGFLPTIAFPTEITAAVLYIWSFVNLFSMVIPVQTILTVMLLMFSYYGIIFLWDAGHWLIRRIPFLK